MDWTERLARVLRGVAGAGPRRPAADLDPDELLREASWTPPPRGGGARAPAGPSPELQRAYANLELTPPVTAEQAKAAWRKLMARYHPDRHQADPQKAELATKVAARLTEAYRLVREHLERA